MKIKILLFVLLLALSGCYDMHPEANAVNEGYGRLLNQYNFSDAERIEMCRELYQSLKEKLGKY